jgi:3',5'-cyclic AMP phosphodiesterase CpdA
MTSFQFMFLADCQLGAYASFSGLSEREVADYARRDLQVHATSRTDGFEWDAERFESAIQTANRLRPEFVVMGGDMVNDPASEDQYDAVMRIASGLDDGIEMKWVPGNHDIAADTVVPTHRSIANYREGFGPDYYAFDWGANRFVVLNTVVLDHPEEVASELADQLEFVEFELGRAAGANRPVILMGHHPLFTSAAHEEDSYWNIPTERRGILLAMIHRYSVRIMFAGHWHRNSYAQDGEFEMVTSGAVGYPLGRDPSGYRLVDVGSRSVRHEYHPLEL